MTTAGSGRQMPAELGQIAAIVERLAREELVPRFSKALGTQKRDGSLVTEADLVMQRRLVVELESLGPGIAVLGEEAGAEEQAAIVDGAGDFWCVDPLDGTTNFTCGIPFYSVSVALVVGGRAELGVVYDPWRDECFSAARGKGAFLRGERQRLKAAGLSLRQACAVIDLKRLPTDLASRLVMERPYTSQRSFGSVALEWCWMGKGRGHVYLHGRQQIWDCAAGQLFFDEAGGYSTRLEGGTVFRRELNPASVVAAVDSDLFREWVDWLGVVP
jgi:myo-inositol-1(or 4)-monophosphatase